MFVPDFKNSIPGYTGHKQQEYEQPQGADVQQPRDPRKQIPGKFLSHFLLYLVGYGGYIPGIKSENVYGETYGKTSFASSAQTFARGIEEPPHLKYNTTMKKEFIDHATRLDQIETTAQLVGVNRADDSYKKVRN